MSQRVNELLPAADGAALELLPAMESHRLPDWPGARRQEQGLGVDLETLAAHTRLKLQNHTGYDRARLLVREGTEGGITYSNRPALRTSIGTLGPTTTNTGYSVPLKVSGLTGELGQQLSLGLDSSSSDGLVLNSKEAGSTLAPKLVLTVK